MKFILSRTSDYTSHSRRWIVGYGLLFWFVTRIIAMLLVTGCMAVYNAFGMNPDALTDFSGNPEAAKPLGDAMPVVLTICVMAPLLEEAIFRLGLSFRRWQVALGAAAIPAYVMWQHLYSLTLSSTLIYVAVTAAVYASVYYCVNTAILAKLKQRYYGVAVWGSAIAFGLIHLIAFSHYSLALIPYMLCVIAVPFSGGCAITYYRVNLGFWWGVGLHVFNNLPGMVMLLME